jgi:hypothetical protein
MMEAVQTSEMLVNLHQTTWYCNPDDSHLNDILYLNPPKPAHDCGLSQLIK